jgi:hypothetical protein
VDVVHEFLCIHLPFCKYCLGFLDFHFQICHGGR